MTVTKFPSKTTPYRVQLPGRFFPDRKRKARYFKSREEAEKFLSQVKRFGLGAIDERYRQAADTKKFEPLILQAVQRLGGDPARLWQAVTDYERRHTVQKPASVQDAISEFLETRKKKVMISTGNADRWRLSQFEREFPHYRMSDFEEADLRRWLDRLVGHKRSIFKTAKVFFKWALAYGYLGADPMAGIAAPEPWKVRKGIYAPATFERMLRIAAGLEGPLPGEEPTKRFAGLLPWFALSGFCGLRSCEAYTENGTSDAIKWSDLYWDRGFIEIREAVAKKTSKSSDGRHIESPHFIDAARAWLELFERNRPESNGESREESKSFGRNRPKPSFVVPVGYRQITTLKREFTAATGIKFVGNGFRNSFASYALTYDGLQGVGKLAVEMGNSEAVCKRFYIKTLEPRTGKAWFSLRPEGPANVVAIQAA